MKSETTLSLLSAGVSEKASTSTACSITKNKGVMMVSTKYNITSMIPANHCFFKHKKQIGGEEATVTPLLFWALATQKGHTSSRVIGIYLNGNGELSACEDSYGFEGYKHYQVYSIYSNN